MDMSMCKGKQVSYEAITVINWLFATQASTAAGKKWLRCCVKTIFKKVPLSVDVEQSSQQLASCLINAHPFQHTALPQTTTPWLAAQATSWQMIDR